MKSRGHLARQLAFSLCGLGGLAWLGAAHGQSATPTAAPVPAPAPSWGAANLPGTTVYQDTYIGGGSLVPDISKGNDSTSDSEGLARSLQIDAVVSALSSHGSGSSTNVEENGVVAKSQWETMAYGSWSLDASARTGGSDLG